MASTPSTAPMSSSPKQSPSSSPTRRSLSTPSFSPPRISVEDVTQPPTRPDDAPLSPRPNSPGSGNDHADGIHNSTGNNSTAKRKRVKSVGWKKRWDEDHNPWGSGRVLIVDCYSRDHSDDGRRKTQAYEFSRVSELEEFYSRGPGKTSEHALRVIHVQNAVFAREFLLKKFNIASSGIQDEVVGTGFGRWAKYEKPQYRAGKPVLNSKTFRTSKDPWRGVSRTGFGVDYFKSYKPDVIPKDSVAQMRFKFMQLNHWEEEMGAAIHGHDVYVQRLSVYIQRYEGPVTLSPSDTTDVPTPYSHGVRHPTGANADSADPELNKVRLQAKVLERLSSLDNNSTIIVFESCSSELPNDTLIQARGEIETRWRRMMFYLSRDDYHTEDRLALDCMDLVLKDIFKGLQASWEKTLSRCEEHVNILEDKIWENPADESLVSQLWACSSLWPKIKKLLDLHLAVTVDLQGQMRELAESPDDDDGGKEEWLRGTPTNLERLAGLIDEELMKPTAKLSDLMYRLAAIRDSRQSVELGTSVWRLSWITFVFLPLTFAVGFFGMNVDTFQSGPGYPSIKWYFIAAVPLMVFVILLYLIIRFVNSRKRDRPLERGIYEQVYHDFAEERPDLWSRVGPRTYVMPKGTISKIKWYLIRRWFHPSKTISKRAYSENNKMGSWTRIQRCMAFRWLRTIDVVPDHDLELGAVTELMSITATALTSHGSTAVSTALGTLPARQPSSRSARSTAGGEARPDWPSSLDSIMVMEESDDDNSGQERDKVRNAMGRNVPGTTATRGGLEDGRGVSIPDALPPADTIGGRLSVPRSFRR